MVAVGAGAGGDDGAGHGADILERGGGLDELFLATAGGGDGVGGGGGQYGYVGRLAGLGEWRT